MDELRQSSPNKTLETLEKDDKVLVEVENFRGQPERFNGVVVAVYPAAVAVKYGLNSLSAEFWKIGKYAGWQKKSSKTEVDYRRKITIP